MECCQCHSMTSGETDKDILDQTGFSRLTWLAPAKHIPMALYRYVVKVFELSKESCFYTVYTAYLVSISVFRTFRNRNWIHEWWLDYIYLKQRSPICCECVCVSLK